jgi:hypothetical protein
MEYYHGVVTDSLSADHRRFYSFDVSCQGTVPEALIAFLDSESCGAAWRRLSRR